MGPGNVVEYLEGKELALAFVVGAEAKGKLPVMTSTGRKETLATKKILFSSSSALSPSAGREEVLQLLESLVRQRTEGASALDMAELWELVLEEGEERDWSLDELAALLSSGPLSELERSITYRALTEARTYFWRKGDNFRIRTKEQVEEAQVRAETEAKRELERAALKDWLAAVWRSGPLEPPAQHREFVLEWKERIRDAAIWGDRSSHFGHVQRLLKELDSRTNDPSFEFMVRLQEWTNDQNLDLLINETPLEFDPEVLQAARATAELLPAALADPAREDLRDWECYSIDDPDTTEVDDALALRVVEDGYEMAIHIADAAGLLPGTDEVLERDMKERATSVYLPDLKVRMLPESLSDDVLSLLAGQDRLAFSFLLHFDAEGELVSSRLTPSQIRVTERYDYDRVDALVAGGDPYWSKFSELAEKLMKRREAKGALNLPFPRMEVRLDSNGSVRLVPDERDSAAQTIVSEAMIMANRVAAEYAAEHGLAAIFRGQKAPDPPVEHRTQWLPHHLFEVRKGFARSTQSLEPIPHSGLGLERYIQATSPIRRYRDLIHQRQIQHHLKYGTQRYSPEEMEEIMTLTSTSVSSAEKMERNRRSYFLHKYLKAQRGKELEAVILASTPERYVLQLCDSLREVEVPHGGGGLKSPGEKVKVKLLSVYPRDKVVKVSAPL